MPTSDHPVLSRFATAIEGMEDDHRPRIKQLLEHAVNFLEQSIEKQNKLVALRKAADERADREQARAEKAERERDALAKEKADDEAKLKAANDALDAEIGEETGGSEAPKPESVPSTAASGAAVTVDPAAGATTHTALDGTTTVVPHDGTTPTATDASGLAVEPQPAAVAEAVSAAADAGVTVPVAEPAIPTMVG